MKQQIINVTRRETGVHKRRDCSSSEDGCGCAHSARGASTERWVGRGAGSRVAVTKKKSQPASSGQPTRHHFDDIARLVRTDHLPRVAAHFRLRGRDHRTRCVRDVLLNAVPGPRRASSTTSRRNSSIRLSSRHTSSLSPSCSPNTSVTASTVHAWVLRDFLDQPKFTALLPR
jgi:hypothetical protein